MRPAARTAPVLALAAVLLAACVGPPPGPGPEDPATVRARIVARLPERLTDRNGWAVDVHAALLGLNLPASDDHVCAVLAVIEQESSYQADPPVPRLGAIAREEVDRRAERLGIPAVAVRLALGVGSPDGRTWGERIEAAKTERELSQVFEDLIAALPLPDRLFEGWNPVHTGGAMQVGIAFAEAHARERRYPYPVAGSIRHEVFTRRGGVYFGTAHLLDYPAGYERMLYRFADYNAGRWASRNAAFQQAVSLLTGQRLVPDGDLVRRDGAGSPGATERAVRALGPRLGLDDAAIRRALEQDDSAAFGRSALYRQVFEMADQKAGRRLPRAAVPEIELHSPKITRKLSTRWFAERVDERFRRCLAR